jgi:acyl carrier protein
VWSPERGAVVNAPAVPEPEVAAVEPTAAVDTSAPTLEVVLEQVIENVAGILKMPLSQVDPAKRVKELGMDSLMSTELRKRLQAVLGAKLTNRQVLTAPSLHAIAQAAYAAIQDGNR